MTGGAVKPSLRDPGRAQGPRRVLNEDERRKLSVDAWGLIAFFQEAGLVEPGELDEALLYLTALDVAEVGPPEVLWVLASVIHDPERLAMILGSSGRRRVEGDALDEAADESEESDDPPVVH